jgi:hypothetical protein
MPLAPAHLGSAKIALALLLRVIFFQKSLAQGLLSQIRQLRV